MFNPKKIGGNICIVLTAWCREDSAKMHGRGIDKIPSRHPQTSNHSAAQILLATQKLSGRWPIQLYCDDKMSWTPAISTLSSTSRTQEVELSSTCTRKAVCRELSNHKENHFCVQILREWTKNLAHSFWVLHHWSLLGLRKLSLTKSSARFICACAQKLSFHHKRDVVLSSFLAVCSFWYHKIHAVTECAASAFELIACTH